MDGLATMGSTAALSPTARRANGAFRFASFPTARYVCHHVRTTIDKQGHDDSNKRYISIFWPKSKAKAHRQVPKFLELVTFCSRSRCNTWVWCSNDTGAVEQDALCFFLRYNRYRRTILSLSPPLTGRCLRETRFEPAGGYPRQTRFARSFPHPPSLY